jgi:molecular chaperone DnaK (HSP70)
MKTGGIDFGTTNTAIGYNDGNKIDMIPLQSN